MSNHDIQTAPFHSVQQYCWWNVDVFNHLSFIHTHTKSVRFVWFELNWCCAVPSRSVFYVWIGRNETEWIKKKRFFSWFILTICADRINWIIFLLLTILANGYGVTLCSKCLVPFSINIINIDVSILFGASSSLCWYSHSFSRRRSEAKAPSCCCNLNR